MNAAGVRAPDRTSRVRAIALSVVGLVLLATLVWFADPARVAAVLRGADLGWIGLALFLIVAGTLLGAINVYLVVAPGKALPFGRFLGAYWAAWALGQVVPGQVGDLVGMSLFLRKRGLALPTAVGRLSVDKVISLFCTLALSTGLVVIFDAPSARLAGVLGAGAAITLIIVLLLSVRWRSDATASGGLRAHLVNGLREAHRVVATRPRVVVANALLTLLKLSAIGACYWVVLHALHAVPGNMIDVTIIANSAGLIAYVPLSANGVGTVEAGGLYLFGLRGVAAPVVIATYLILRLANLALAWGGAAVLLLISAWRRQTAS